MASKVIDLDSDPAPAPLTQEQRNRIQQQKKLALERRRRSRMRGGSPQSPVELSSSPRNNVIDLCNSDEDVTMVTTVRPGSKRSQACYVTDGPTSKRPMYQVPDGGTTDPNIGKPSSKQGGNTASGGTLSDEQLDVLKAVMQRKSVFVTGAAGTGKSYVTELAIQALRTLYPRGFVYVTASTGLAACALNGTTLHSFAGVGLGTASKEELAQTVSKGREKLQRWLNADALVIDEISMIDAELFDKIDYVGRTVRKCNKPFGGLQLVVSGDFFQLPPVQAGGRKSFAFKAKCWDECFDLQVELTHVFRQKEGAFVDMLNEIRRGRCSEDDYHKLLASTKGSTNLGITPTKLYPLKVDVNRENQENLRALRSTPVNFTAVDSGRADMLKLGRAEETVTLAVGAQVMLIKNIDQAGGLVNGSRGVVVRFVVPEKHSALEPPHHYGASGWPVVRFTDGEEVEIGPEKWSVIDGKRELASRSQVPLILAWALSVHKCQGMTLDSVETDLSRSFEYGMVYVALSRIRSLSGLRLLGFDPKKIKVHPEVVEFYERLGKR